VIWELVKRDPAWKMALGFAATSPLIWLFGSSKAPEIFIAPILPMIMAFSYSRFRQRYTLLQVTLPIAGKQLFLARVASMMALIWLPIFSFVAALAVGGAQWTWADSLPLFACGAILTVGLMLIQSVRVRSIEPPEGLPTTVFITAVAISGPVAMTGLISPGSILMIAVLGGCALVSAGLFLKGWAEVPKSFQLALAELDAVRTDPAGPVEPDAVRTDRAGPATRTTPWWPVLRELYFGSARASTSCIGMLVLACMIPIPILGSGMAGFAFIILLTSFFEYCTGLRWLLHLPISARKLLWAVWLPSTAAIVVGLVVNAAAGSFVPPHPPAIDPKRPLWNVELPRAYWGWTLGRSAPLIEAPWGERSQPTTVKELGFTFYNPYSIGLESSQRFIEWQSLRATQAIYGRPIPASQLAEIGRMKTILQQPKAQIIIPALVLLFFLIHMCALHLIGWQRLRNTNAYLRIYFACAPITLVFLAVMPLGLGAQPAEVLELYLSRVLPNTLWILTLMALPPMAGLYWLAEKLLRENEFGQVETLSRNYKPQIQP